MKVRVLSDLHLEFSKKGDEAFDPGTGDVLILAGDICDAVAFIHRCDVDLRATYLRFFERCVLNYDKVFYVMGNHEHYNHVFSRTAEVLRTNLPDGVTLLDNQSEFYNGYHFVGATMWSDFGGGDPECLRAAEDGLNDYSYIFSNDEAVTITPEFIAKQNKNTVEWFDQCLPTLNGPIFMITHHCPSFKSIDPDYVTSSTVTAYASDLEDLIEKTPNLMYWAHGHVHSSKCYTVGNCTVVCNPKGYPEGVGKNEKFNVKSSLELA